MCARDGGATSPGRIVIVDDEPRLVRLVRANLEAEGYDVATASDANEALALLSSMPTDLVILDVMLPNMDGYELCQRITETYNVPIIMLTAKAHETDKIRGLDLGADDYLTKPFHPEELLARVRAVLRRVRGAPSPPSPNVVTVGGLSIDLARRRVARDGREVDLSPTEYRLLHQLALQPGRVVPHEELLTRVWGAEYREEVEYLRQYVYYLRHKLEDDPRQPRYIRSKPGLGYFLSVPVDAAVQP
jgi:two-component system KDP operon response regulator KdpE